MTHTNTPAPSRTVLIADSDARVRQICRKALDKERYLVLHAADAEEMLSIATDHSLDIILADASLLGIDGIAMIHRLQPVSRPTRTSLIILTELNDASITMEKFGSSVDDYLVKPLRKEELAARLQTLADRNRALEDLHRCRDQLGENARALELLLDFSLVLAETEQLDRIVQESAAVTASLSSCRRAAVLLPNADFTSLRIAAAVGIDSQTVAELAIPIGEGVSGRVYESGSSIAVTSASEADPDEDVYDSHLFARTPALALAMRGSERTVGVLYLADRVGQHPFTEKELNYLNLLSNCAAAAMQSILTQKAREQAREAITVALANLAEHRDDDTGKHLERMTGYCLILAEKLRIDSDYAPKIDCSFIDDLRRAAPLHDIGKVAIPDHILLKPGPLTPDEMKIMRTHATIGAETIYSARSHSPDSRFLTMAEEIAHNHHEWVDGNGYPRGIRGINIPLAARIAALADVYDALTTRRVYKKAMSHTQAKSIIEELSGQQFDPIIVQAFLASEEEFKRLAAELRDLVDDDEEEEEDIQHADSSNRSGIDATDWEPNAIIPRDRPAIVLNAETTHE